MVRIMKVIVCVILVSSMFIIGIKFYSLLIHQKTFAQNKHVFQTPTWHIGDWWKVERSVFPFVIAMPIEKIKWSEPRQEVYKVEAIVDIEGYSAYKVSCAAVESSGTFLEDYLYFNVTDLSLFRHESLDREGKVSYLQMQTPGQPTWAGGFPLCWPVFPLVEGEVKDVNSNPIYKPYEFRRPDGSIMFLGEGQIFLQKQCEIGKIYPRQEVFVETVEWGEQKRQVFRVRFREKGKGGRIEDEANLRWLPGIPFPAQAWGKIFWVRLIDSSRGLPFEIPRPRVEGSKVVEGQ